MLARAWGWSSIGVALLALACAAPAHAAKLGSSGGFSYVSASKPMPDPVDGVSVATVAAKCPKGTVPVGGGASIDGDPTKSAIAASYPDGNKWAAALWTLDSPDGLKATAWGVCSKSKSKVSTESLDFASAPSGAASGSVSCDSGASPSGGGFSVQVANPADYYGNYIYAIEEDGSVTGWTASVFHRVDGSDTATVYDVCMKGGKPKYPTKQVASADPALAAVNCKKGTSVTGGGYFDLGDLGTNSYASVSMPTDSAKDKDKVPDDGWSVTMSDPNETSLTAGVVAACR